MYASLIFCLFCFCYKNVTQWFSYDLSPIQTYCLQLFSFNFWYFHLEVMLFLQLFSDLTVLGATYFTNVTAQQLIFPRIPYQDYIWSKPKPIHPNINIYTQRKKLFTWGKFIIKLNLFVKKKYKVNTKRKITANIKS